MDNALEVFSDNRFGKVRTVIINNEPWFVAKDVCHCLDIKNNRQALSRLDDDEKSDVILNDGSQNRSVNIINEYGLYSLTLASRKYKAKQFKRWITHKVIPSIRKTGEYKLDRKRRLELKRIASIEVRNALTNMIKENVPDSPHKKYAYSNYTNLIYKNIFGKNAKQLKEQYNLNKKDNLRDIFDDNELQGVQNAEFLINGLIGCGWVYGQIKEFIQNNVKRLE